MLISSEGVFVFSTSIDDSSINSDPLAHTHTKKIYIYFYIHVGNNIIF